MPTFSQWQAAIEQIYAYQLERQPNRSTTLLNMLPKKAGAGQNVAFTVSTGTGEGRSMAEGADVTTFSSDDKRPAVLPWKIYGDSFEITHHIEDVMASTNQSMKDVFGTELLECSQRVATKIAKDILTGDGTGTNMLGLLATAGGFRAAGTYAGIDRAAVTQWAGNETNLAGAVTYNALRAIKRTSYDADGTDVDVIFTSSNQHEKIGALAEWSGVRRTINEATSRGQKFTLPAGYNALELDGIGILKERQMPTDAVVGIPMAHTYIAYLPPAGARTARGEVLANIPIAGSDEFQMGGKNGETGLYAQLYRKGKTGSKTQFWVEVTLNVVCKRPKAAWYLRGLT